MTQQKWCIWRIHEDVPIAKHHWCTVCLMLQIRYWLFLFSFCFIFKIKKTCLNQMCFVCPLLIPFVRIQTRMWNPRMWNCITYKYTTALTGKDSWKSRFWTTSQSHLKIFPLSFEWNGCEEVTWNNATQ